jgi:hypothetical protein
MTTRTPFTSQYFRTPINTYPTVSLDQNWFLGNCRTFFQMMMQHKLSCIGDFHRPQMLLVDAPPILHPIVPAVATSWVFSQKIEQQRYPGRIQCTYKINKYINK